MDNQISEFSNYSRKENLIRRKLAGYIPIMMVTNLSVLLLTSVDSLVAGNFKGSEAVSAITIFYPINLVLGILSVITGCGISTSISTAMGENNSGRLLHIKKVSVWVMIISAILIGIIVTIGDGSGTPRTVPNRPREDRIRRRTEDL